MNESPTNLCATCQNIENRGIYVSHRYVVRAICREWVVSFPNVTECRFYVREPGSDDAPLKIVDGEVQQLDAQV